MPALEAGGLGRQKGMKKMAENNKILISGILGELAEDAAALMEKRGYAPVLMGDVDSDDIDYGLAHVDNDVCVAVVALVGQYCSWLEEHPDERPISVLAPELCRDCRSVSMPDLLPAVFSRADLSDIEVVALESGEIKDLCPASTEPVADERPVIGVCGNMPILTTPQFRHVVIDHLEQSGCRVVMPPLERIADKREFLTAALEFFDEQNVETVICILPFGCLGGHVFARGQLRKLQKQFPNIQVTALDYDPSASDINLVNRTELVIQSAKEKVPA